MDTNNRNINNKLIKVGAIATGVILVGASAAFAASDNDAELSDNEKMHKKMHPLYNLTVEEVHEIQTAVVELRIEHLNEIIEILDEKDVDTTEIEAILDDFKYLEEFLAEVDLDNTTKQELREAFFELRPEKESAKLVKDVLQENLTEEELEELKEGFKADYETLREEYDLPEKKYKKGHGENSGTPESQGEF